MRTVLCALILLAACAAPAKPPPNPACQCGARVCGSVCGQSCGVCANDGVCASDGLSCRAALAIGAACATDSDCGNGRLCLSGPTAPGGYCTRSCSDANGCPGDAKCELGPDGASVCLAACGASAVCRTAAGYRCGAGGVCPACVPVCSQRTCGDDGCGGSCGSCADPGVVCDGGSCVAGDYLPAGRMVDATNEPDARWDFAALPDANGRIFLIGGREAVRDASSGARSAGSSAVTRYDPQTGAFDFPLAAKLPQPIAHPEVAMLDGVPFLAGGVIVGTGANTPDAPVTSAWKFVSQGWTPIAAPSHPSMDGALVEAGGQLWLLAGDVAGAPAAFMESYDATNDRWSDGAPARPTARSHFAAATDGQRIFVMGGWDGTQALATVEVFDPSSRWSAAPDLPLAVADATAVVAGGRIFLFGGFDGPGQGQPLAVVQTIDLQTHRTALVGMTYDNLVEEAPALLRNGGVVLFGGVTVVNSAFAPHDDVVRFHLPAP